VPRLNDLSTESPATRALYGIDLAPTDDFGRQCLLARRFAEAGVRFIEVCSGYKWDQHDDLRRRHAANAQEVDRPIAALLTDLKARGLLDDTLVVWGGEFGRTPVCDQLRTTTDAGRDHNPQGFTMWLAGGGVRGGRSYGETDEFGYYAVRDKVHMHDLHATILHLLGLDHERLTYRYAGRDFRLTDVYGRVVTEVL
jgi:arylsulfatase A-like enzyme